MWIDQHFTYKLVSVKSIAFLCAYFEVNIVWQMVDWVFRATFFKFKKAGELGVGFSAAD